MRCLLHPFLHPETSAMTCAPIPTVAKPKQSILESSLYTIATRTEEGEALLELPHDAWITATDGPLPHDTVFLVKSLLLFC
jgi:hypothetical protein